MKHSPQIYNELKEVSPFLANVDKTNVFSVPEGYFELLTSQVLTRIATPFFDLPASEPYFSGVPQGYFDNLPTKILDKIKKLESDDASHELKELSPVLHALQNENVFSVPERYFEDLPTVILNNTRSQAKVVRLTPRNSVWKYAIAAMVTGIVAVSALWVNNRSTPQTAVITKTKTLPLPFQEAIQYKNEQQIDEGIARLNDDDIIKYLQATGSNTDDDLLATSVQESDLPSEADYLLNDKALDTYLNEIDVKPNEN